MDEVTFVRVFGRSDWAVMFILARGGATHAELCGQRGGGARLPLEVEIDFTRPFGGSDVATWQAEYARSVHPEPHWFGPPAEGGDAPTFRVNALEWPAPDALGIIDTPPSPETS